MFKLLALIFCAVATNKLSDAAVAILPPQEKPPEFASEEGCYVPTLNRVLPYNVPYSPQDGKSCMQYECQDNGDTILETCGVKAVGPNCVILEGNKYLAYPDCCDGGIVCNPSAKEDPTDDS